MLVFLNKVWTWLKKAFAWCKEHSHIVIGIAGFIAGLFVGSKRKSSGGAASGIDNDQSGGLEPDAGTDTPANGAVGSLQEGSAASESGALAGASTVEGHLQSAEDSLESAAGTVAELGKLVEKINAENQPATTSGKN